MIKLAMIIFALDVFRFIFVHIAARMKHIQDYSKDEQIEFWKFYQSGLVGAIWRLGVFFLCALHTAYNWWYDNYIIRYYFIVVHNHNGRKLAEGFASTDLIQMLKEHGFNYTICSRTEFKIGQLGEKPLNFLEIMRRSERMG